MPSPSLRLVALFVTLLLGLAEGSVLAGTDAAAPPTATADPPTTSDDAAGYWSKTLPLHPKAVHLPIALCILMPLVAGLVWLGVARRWFEPRTWLIVGFLQCATLVSSVAALQTGDDDGEKVDGYASELALSTHRQRGEVFVYVAVANLALCAAAFWFRGDRGRQQVLGAVAILGLFAGGYAGYRVGDAGGRLVYVANASDAHK